MKKFMAIILMVVVILLTGCEKNRLVCTYNEEDIENISSKTKYVFNFNDESVKDVTMTTEVTLDGDYNNDSFIATYKEMASAASEEYNNIDGISANVNSKKNVITLKVEMNVASMTDENKELYGVDLTKEELKKTLEESGYTCK